MYFFCFVVVVVVVAAAIVHSVVPNKPLKNDLNTSILLRASVICTRCLNTSQTIDGA